MISRRSFLISCTAIFPAPLAARAQQAGRVRRIGVLMNNAEDDPESKAELAAFRQGLLQLGWSEDRNIRIDTSFAADRPDQYQVLAKKLVALQLDAILAYTTPITAALQRESRTIPIVFAQVSDPVGSGLVASLARPGGNLTGLLLYEKGITGKWAAMLKEIAPHLKRAALLANPKTPKLLPMTTLCARLRPQLSRSQSSWCPAPSRTLLTSSASSRLLRACQMAACSFCRVARPPCTVISLLRWRPGIACRRSIHSVSTSRLAASCPTVPTSSTSPDRRHRMSTAFCAEPIPPNFRYRRL